MLRFVFVLITIFFSNAEYQDICGDNYDRIGAFRRCIDPTTPFPFFNTTQPTCTLSTSQLQEIVANSRYQQQYYFGCDDLIRYADYQQLNNLNFWETSSISLNSTHSKSLATAVTFCRWSATERLCNHYNLCFRDRENATEAYERNACMMEFSRLVSHGSDGVFNEIIYLYLLELSLRESHTQEGNFNLAITQDYLYTCTSLFRTRDIESCVIELLNACFLLENEEHTYLCYYGIQDNFCRQFSGDDQLMCYVILEIKMALTLENQCTIEDNENTCEEILTSIIDEKPIADLNSTDIDQVKAVVAGSSYRANYTNETLTQLNKIVDYFTLNESIVSKNIDKQDANTFLSVISTLTSKEESMALQENNETNSSTALLNNLAVMSKLIGSAVLTSDDQVEGNFAYSDDNIGLFLTVGSVKYSSGALKLNGTNSSAEIIIPPTSICGFGYEASRNDDSYEYYDYPKICNGLPSCKEFKNGITYTCYDMYTLFGECSKRIAIPSSCPSVVATSVAKLSLPGTLPPNMTIASNVLNVQIVTRNKDSSISSVHSLNNNASLHFKLAKPIKEHFIPKCYFWNTTENVWSDVGIETLVLSDVDVLCNTSHLTSFAVLVDHQGLIESASNSTNNGTSIISSTELQALSIVGYIGPSISLLCLIIALAIMIYLRKEMNVNFLYHVHLNLCISLLLGLIVFLFGLETAIHYDWLCSIVAVLLHYLFLCVFAWMLAEGITLCITVVHVWGMKFLKWQIFLLTAWGIPLFIVAVSFGIRHDLYGTDKYCWLSSQKGLVWAFLGPALAIAVINTVFLMVTIIQLVRVTRNKFDHRKNSKNLKTAKSAIFGAIVLFPLLGITWIIGVFAVSQSTTVFLWLFTICNSLQGVFILIFHVLRHKTVLTWIVRKYPCMDKWIEVHTSSEVIRRMSAMKLSTGNLAPRDMLSAKFGLGRNSSYDLSSLIVSTSNENSIINSELDTIAEEGDNEGDNEGMA